MANYGQVIENFRKAATDPKSLEKISSKRIEKTLEKEFPGITERIMQGTSFPLVEQISEVLKPQNKERFTDISDEERTKLRQIKKNTKQDTIDFYYKCKNISFDESDTDFDFVRQIKKDWMELDKEPFVQEKRHYYNDWAQFCRYCIIEYERVKYMEERIWQLYDMHLQHYTNAYFRFQDEEIGETNFPRDFPRIRLLEDKSREFFLIHKMLLDNVSFNSKKRGSSSAKPRGSIDWKKTIQLQSKGETASFSSRQNMRDFVTPENKLFIAAAYWIMHKADELLANENIEFLDKEMLSIVKIKMKNMIDNFPFRQVPDSVKREKLDNEYGKKISNLVRESSERIATGKIQNAAYKKLLKWIDDFRSNAGLRTLAGKTQNDSLVFLSLRRIDTMYEIWILFELIHRIFIIRDPDFVRHPETGEIEKIVVNWNGKNVEIFYDRKFYRGQRIKKFTHLEESSEQLPQTELVMVKQECKPDYAFRSDGKFFAVFDAKNYSNDPRYARVETGSKADAFLKIMGYAENLKCKLGLAILPHKEWHKGYDEQSPFDEEVFKPIFLLPDRKINEDPNENPKRIDEIVAMLDRAISQ